MTEQPTLPEIDRHIGTQAALEALPHGAVIMDRLGDVFRKGRVFWFVMRPRDNERVPILPCTLLWPFPGEGN